MYTEHFKSSMQALNDCLYQLYGKQWNFYQLLNRIAALIEANSVSTGTETDKSEDWFLNEPQTGITLYVDLFAGNLRGLKKRIPYLAELGITYVHLMPLFLSPTKQNDGGYAVSSYRKVNPKLGTIKELTEIADLLHKNGMRLVIDFVFNHTSDEHEWALKAKNGDPKYKDFYFMYQNKDDADEWNKTLREIFPTMRRGSFSFNAQAKKWVWTTFNSFQWDLNYANPEVFLAMCEEMIHLAKIGADVLRLDALAFIWKKKGTCCENLTEAHTLIQAFQYVAHAACPGLVFKSEAIVHPDEVATYIRKNECRLSYNPLQMALFWEAAATRSTRLLTESLRRRWAIPDGCAWVNYIRCHDDIGWTFSDEDAARCGIDAYSHRQFLNHFYTNQFEGSFARGEPFQQNPQNGDCRISGTMASLAGLEQALQMYTDGNPASTLYAQMATNRICMMYALLFALPGIPLLNSGEETATLNDYSYKKDVAHKDDSRWVHRTAADWQRIARLQKRKTPPTSAENAQNWLEGYQAQAAAALRTIIRLRKEESVLVHGDISFYPEDICHETDGSCRIFSFARKWNGSTVIIVANFSDKEQQFTFGANACQLLRSAEDIITGVLFNYDENCRIEPWQTLWLHAPKDQKRYLYEIIL